MPKIHSTAACRLARAEATIQKQADRILELEATVLKMATKLTRHGIKVDSLSSSRRELRSSQADDFETPSYLQATASSRAKQHRTNSKPSTSKGYCLSGLSVGANKYVYLDGKLILDGPPEHTAERTPHYATETMASYRRQTSKRGGWTSTSWRLRGHHYSSDMEETQPVKKCPSSWDGPYEEYEVLHEIPPSPPSSSVSENDDEKEDDQGTQINQTDPVELLGKQTRLGEIPWGYSPTSDAHHPAYYVYVPSKFAFRTLQRGLILAQEAFFDTARECWPDIQREFFPGGPHEVRFGRTDSETCVNWLTFQHRIGGRGGPRNEWRVQGALSNVAYLRNAVCHYDGRGLRQVTRIDDLLKCAQELAVSLLDAGRAHKIRALRDELRPRAEMELGEIERNRTLAELPECRLRWKVHHEMLFRDTYLMSRSKHPLFSVPNDYPVAILKVTEQWEKSGWKIEDHY
ncbi:hypothetical protein F4779DRAFT_615985 [Xylariaceae sp. FL0662B]|nr:hypothetical protein F4779DRAFT_615985 [Xylariaceae sp. FL0662B]